jgi:hypothetical protein
MNLPDDFRDILIALADALIRNKRATGRLQDLADIEALLSVSEG